MKFNYVSIEDLDSKNVNTVLEPGECRFIIKSSFEKGKDGMPLRTNSGVYKTIIQFEVSDSNNSVAQLFEHVTENTAWKIRQILDSVGRISLYSQRGEIDFNKIIGLRGKCIVKTEPARDTYPERSVVDRFLPSSQTKGQNPVYDVQNKENMPVDSEDDDLPF